MAPLVPGVGTVDVMSRTGWDGSEFRVGIPRWVRSRHGGPTKSGSSERFECSAGRGVLTQALGYERQADAPDFLVPPDDQGVRIHLDETDRTHLDLWVDRKNSDLETEVDRLVALGAERVDWTYPEDADFVVLADTEGNLFCVIA